MKATTATVTAGAGRKRDQLASTGGDWAGNDVGNEPTGVPSSNGGLSNLQLASSRLW